MWLLPALSPVARLALRAYYRVTVAGGGVPAAGPVLLVANHPNSLLDPAGVAAAAGRPVRFLAKAPLFTDPAVGWLVRGAGAIPVYRASDDPAAMGRNEETFRAVHAALGDGAAVGIFPEGVSHSEPSLVPLKTGAARIALGAAALVGGSFPIVPVGLTFRAKERFRSEALAVIGDPFEWADLAGRGVDDPDAVRELTDRIEDALRAVTVNVERWEDAPLVEGAEAIYTAELGASEAPGDRLARLRGTAEALARYRRAGDPRSSTLAREVLRHVRLLRVLGLTPGELGDAPAAGAAALWTLRQLAFFVVLAPLGVAGMVLYWLPYRLTGAVEARAHPLHDVRATYRVLAGAALLLAWTLALAAGAGALWGAAAGVLALPLLPALAACALLVRDRWAQASTATRRFFLLHRRAELVRGLRERQRELAQALQALWAEAETGAEARPEAAAGVPPRGPR